MEVNGDGELNTSLLRTFHRRESNKKRRIYKRETIFLLRSSRLESVKPTNLDFRLVWNPFFSLFVGFFELICSQSLSLNQMVVRSQEEVIVLTMELSAEECLELHRETGAYDRFTLLSFLILINVQRHLSYLKPKTTLGKSIFG